MKYLILTLALLTGSASAEVNMCDEVYELAGVVMKARQNGVSMPKIYAVIDEQFPEPSANRAVKDLINSAYGEPRYEVEKYQKRAISNFANRWFMSCGGA